MSSKRSRRRRRTTGSRNPQARPRSGPNTSPKAAPRTASRTAAPAPQTPEEKPGNPNLILGAAIVIALAIGIYYHVLVMHQMSELVGGLTMLDHRPFGYSVAEVDTLRAAMTRDDLGQLSWIHKTAGMLFTLFAALATALSVGLHGPRSRWRRALYGLPIAFIVVALAQNILVDRLLGRPGDGTVGVTATATVVTWVLLAGCVVTVVWILVGRFVRELRRRLADPSLQRS